MGPSAKPSCQTLGKQTHTRFCVKDKPKRDPLALLGSHLESKLEAVCVRVVALPLGSLQTPIGSALAAWCAGSGTTPKWERKKTMVRQHWWT